MTGRMLLPDGLARFLVASLLIENAMEFENRQHVTSFPSAYQIFCMGSQSMAIGYQPIHQNLKWAIG